MLADAGSTPAISTKILYIKKPLHKVAFLLGRILSTLVCLQLAHLNFTLVAEHPLRLAFHHHLQANLSGFDTKTESHQSIKTALSILTYNALLPNTIPSRRGSTPPAYLL